MPLEWGYSLFWNPDKRAFYHNPGVCIDLGNSPLHSQPLLLVYLPTMLVYLPTMIKLQTLLLLVFLIFPSVSLNARVKMG